MSTRKSTDTVAEGSQPAAKRVRVEAPVAADEVKVDLSLNEDWPSRFGEIDLDRHDLAHMSSVTEWWYYNAHLTAEDGHKFSAFICFFRTRRDKATDANGNPQFASALNWAISDVDNQEYYADSVLDRQSPKMILKQLEAGNALVGDKRLKRAMQEIAEKGNVPLPDRLFPADSEPSVSDESMNIDFVYSNVTKNEAGAYHVTARHAQKDVSLDLNFVPQKPVQRHGVDGVVQLGGDGKGMFYYFIPRNAVSGTLSINGKTYTVQGSGWYDHEFGGADDEKRRRDCAWNWVSAQLDNGVDITGSCLLDQNSMDHLEDVVLVVDADGQRSQHLDFTFDVSDMWTSIRTFRDYPTKFRVRSPEAELDLELEACFPDQEFQTLIARPAYWEGRCTVKGTLKGEQVTGVCFVERNGFGGGETTLSSFFKAVGKTVRQSVVDAYPDVLTRETARTLIATEETDHYLDGVPLDVLQKTLLAPVRLVSDRGGKSWRSYAALACAEVVGGDCRRIMRWLPMPEFLHVGSLIVDDIQDKSLTRRGGPCSHLVFGEPLAINAGTAAYFQTEYYLTLANDLGPELLNKLYSLYFGCLRGAHAGQALDIYGLDYMMDDVVQNGGGPLLESRVLAIHRLKTAVPAGALSRMGALVGNGTPEQVEAVGMFFEAVGVAFQIMDDVLNLRGLYSTKADLKSGEQLKTLGEDIMAGKVTMPIAKAMQTMNLEQRTALWAKVKSKPQDQEEVNKVIADLEAVGAIDACVEQAVACVEDAWKNLDPLIPDSFSKMMLRAFSWFVIDRHN